MWVLPCYDLTCTSIFFVQKKGSSPVCEGLIWSVPYRDWIFVVSTNTDRLLPVSNPKKMFWQTPMTLIVTSLSTFCLILDLFLLLEQILLANCAASCVSYCSFNGLTIPFVQLLFFDVHIVPLSALAIHSEPCLSPYVHRLCLDVHIVSSLPWQFHPCDVYFHPCNVCVLMCISSFTALAMLSVKGV